MNMMADAVIVEEMKKNAFSVKQITKLSDEITDFHVRSNRDRKRGVVGLVMDRDLEDRREILSCANRRVM